MKCSSDENMKCQQSKVWVSLGIVLLAQLLIPVSATAGDSRACLPQTEYVVRMIGGRKFQIDAVVPLSVRLQWEDSNCLLSEQRREFETVSQLQSVKNVQQTPFGAPRLIIVIDDFGYRNDWVVDGFLSLEFPVTFAVIPGHQFSSETAARAHQSGHEVLVHMPMQAILPAPGELEYRLTSAMSSTEITKRVRHAILEIPEATGMNNHQGSAATADIRVMDVVASELRKQDMFFLDSVTSAGSVAVPVMRAAGVPVIRRDLFLDSVDDVAHVRSKLDRLIEIADDQGYAVGIGHVRPNTLLALQQASAGIKVAGYEFVVASELSQNYP